MADPKITLEEVRHVAALARLALGTEETEVMRAQLDSILGYTDELDSVDVKDVEPTFHAVPMAAPLREDRVLQSLQRDEVLGAAPAHANGGFAVPRVLESDG